MSTTQRAAGADYRARYLDLLDEKEREDAALSRRVGEVSALLERLARAVTAAGDRPLARRVESVCEALRLSPLDAALTRKLEGLREDLLPFMDARERDSRAVLVGLRVCADQLEPHLRGFRLRRAFKQLRRSLDQPDLCVGDGIAGLAAVQLKVLSTLASQTTPGNEEEPAATLDAPLPDPSDVAVIAPGTGASGGSVTASDADGSPREAVAQHADWSALADLLRRMLDLLELPASAREEAASLDRDLSDGLDEASAVAAVERLSELVTVCLCSLRREFSGFLDGVERRLDELLEALFGADALVRDAGEQRARLAGVMEEQLTRLRSETRAAGDLEVLKRSIETHLETLTENLGALGAQERTSADAAQTQLDAMRARLVELESESADARRALEAQRRLAHTDPLTGVANRLGFEAQSAAALTPEARDAGPVSVVMVDIDHFKQVNDTHGHDAGDRALGLVANILRSRVRASDVCARYGGEEFVVLLGGADARRAAAVVEQMRGFLESCGFNYKGVQVPLTASFGVAELAKGEAVEAALRRADAALYRAKETGRNRVVVAE